MRYVPLLMALWLGNLLLAALPAYADHGAKQDAVHLVQKALKHIEAVGLSQALEDFKKPDNPFQNRDLYIFVYDFQGNNLANSTPLSLPFTNLKEVRSADGKLVVQEMIEMSKSSGGGAFEYDWLNPETGKVQSKISYFRRIPGFDGFIGAGYYKPEQQAQAELCSKEEAVALVDKALKHIEQVGLTQALEDFKKPDNPFQYRELYVFVYDYQGHNLANSTLLNPPSDELLNYRSPDGKYVIQQMIEMTKSSGGGAFEYDMLNPHTHETQSKISYFKKIPNFDGFIGCGYYRP